MEKDVSEHGGLTLLGQCLEHRRKDHTPFYPPCKG